MISTSKYLQGVLLREGMSACIGDHKEASLGNDRSELGDPQRSHEVIALTLVLSTYVGEVGRVSLVRELRESEHLGEGLLRRSTYTVGRPLVRQHLYSSIDAYSR
jgi:hypothetical protein